MKNHIEKQIELKAPVSRVWRALTDHQEFGQWFQVKLEGPFVPGQLCQGAKTYAGAEGQPWSAVVQEMTPERLFSFTWHPYSKDAARALESEPSTLVVFRLEASAGGTLLTVTESGFDQLSADRYFEAFNAHEGGWTSQLRNITRHVEQ